MRESLDPVLVVGGARAQYLFGHRHHPDDPAEEVHHLFGPRQAAEVTVNDNAVEAVVDKDQEIAATKLAVYGSHQPILWKPPFHVLKMCVWIGGEYRWAWRKWSFTSQIFQWPASPSSLQWIEGPVAYAGREADPFAGLKKPSRQFGMRDITDAQGQLRPGAFQCNPTPQLPYALVVEPGKRAILAACRT